MRKNHFPILDVSDLDVDHGIPVVRAAWLVVSLVQGARMLRLYQRRLVVTGGLLLAILLATLCLGVAGLARWREAHARSQEYG